MLSSLLFPLYAKKENCKLDTRSGDVVKVEERFLVHGLKQFKKGDNLLSIDLKSVAGLSGSIIINFELLLKNVLYFNINMEDVDIDETIINDIDLDCTLFGYPENGTGVIHHFYDTKASSEFHKFPYDLPDADWKLIKFKEISKINESINLSETIAPPFRKGFIIIKFTITTSSIKNKKIKFEIPMPPINEPVS